MESNDNTVAMNWLDEGRYQMSMTDINRSNNLYMNPSNFQCLLPSPESYFVKDINEDKSRPYQGWYDIKYDLYLKGSIHNKDINKKRKKKPRKNVLSFPGTPLVENPLESTNENFKKPNTAPVIKRIQDYIFKLYKSTFVEKEGVWSSYIEKIAKNTSLVLVARQTEYDGDGTSNQLADLCVASITFHFTKQYCAVLLFATSSEGNRPIGEKESENTLGS